jgi:hypothetical protein
MDPSRSARKHRHFLFLRGFYLIVQIAQHPGSVHDAGKTIRDHIEYCAYTCQQEDRSNGELYDMGNSCGVSSALHCCTSLWGNYFIGAGKKTER